ncbi:hypothetical protein EW026_g7329 [Hermanssonia centrifuga]|uniref:Alpha-type protein kinase domain-containing protein n=1 Tax=Hermanssonia centrifuga TaxID=98765 RepID=A0A4S4K8D6_9APHY|nr:hypothetical protein EW026_g7329 [Hermanssonia centrifuga]
MAHLLPVKLKLQNIGEICDGIGDIDAHIGATELRQLCFDRLYPLWQEWSQGTPLDINDTQLYASKNGFVALTPPPAHVPDRNCLYQYCLKSGTGKHAVERFHKGTHLELQLRVPNHIYDAALDQDDAEDRDVAMHHTGSLSHGVQVSAATHTGIAHGRVVTDKGNMSTTDHDLATVLRPPIPDNRNVITAAAFDTCMALELAQNSSKLEYKPLSGKRPSSIQTVHICHCQVCTTVQTKRQRTETIVDARGAHLRLSRYRFDLGIAHAAQNAPKLQDFKSAVSKEHFAHCEFIPIQRLELSELLGGKLPSLDHMPRLTGSLTVDFKNRLGKPGSFKTAHIGRITLHEDQAFPGFESLRNTFSGKDICVKQMFEREGRTGNIFRLSDAQELTAVWPEFECLQWGTVIHDASLNTARRIFEKQSKPPHFPLMPTRMVRGMLAICLGETRKRAVLIEELIDPTHEGEFRKFVHNSEQTPLVSLRRGKESELGEQLCFLQHIQWIMSGENCFISDYQGGSTLLTDPQIITNPKLLRNGSVGVFANGNTQLVLRDLMSALLFAMLRVPLALTCLQAV